MKKLIAIFLIFTTNLIYGQVFFAKDLKLIGNIKSVYQLEFRIVEKEGKILKGDTIVCTHLKYEFDNKNKLLSEEYCFMGDSSSLKYFYDEKGRLVERTISNHFERKFEYDSLGKKIKLLLYENGLQKDIWTYRYDSNGNNIEKTGYLGNKRVERWFFEYDKNNNKIKEFMVKEDSANTPTSIKIFEYNENGRLTTVIRAYEKTELTAVEKYKYNDKNEITEYYLKNEVLGIEQLKTFKYVIDKKGNWIQKIEFINTKPTTIIERKIEYR